MDTGSSGSIKSVDKALDILLALGTEKYGLQLREIAQKVQLNTSTTHHLLSTLKQRGFVDQDQQTAAYRLGLGLIRLSNTYLTQIDLYTAGIGPMQELRDRSGETSYLTLLQGSRLISPIELSGTRPIQARVTHRDTSDSELHATAAGKALMAYMLWEEAVSLLSPEPLTQFTAHTNTNLDALREELAQIRKQGYALDHEEHREGVSCVAAPIFTHHGECMATASIACPTTSVERMENLTRLVVETATKVSIHLGFVPSPPEGGEEAVSLALH